MGILSKLIIQRWKIMFDLKGKYNLRENRKLMLQISNKICLVNYSIIYISLNDLKSEKFPGQFLCESI